MSTSIARTILDLAAVLAAPALLRGIKPAHRIERLDLRQLERLIARHPTRKGPGN